MGLIQRSRNFLTSLPVKLFSSVIQAEVDKKFTAAVNREEEDRTWRRITDVQRKRDLPPLKHDKMIRVVDWLNDRNPIARKVIRLTADFVVGEGITIKADKVQDREEEQKELQGIIDGFWDRNEWDLKQFQRIEELGLYGEQIYRTFINEFNGDVKLGVFDPEMINKILTNPENQEELTTIVPKGHYSDTDEVQLDIIRPQRIITVDATSGRKIPVGPTILKGEAFFFNVNKGSHATRGKSDLLSYADWLDIYDRTLYTMTERVTFLLTFIWEVIITGATPAQLKQRLKDLQMNPPKPGSYQVHNENEKWEANAPDLRGGDFAEFFKTVSTMFVGGSGFPEHWLLGKGEDVNKASAKEMSDPTIRQLKRRQKYIQYMFRQMIDFQILQKIKKGELSGRLENFPYTIIIPEPSKKEADLLADAIAKLTPALAVATTSGFLTSETATKVLSMLVSQMGIETKPEDENKKMGDMSEAKLYEAVKNVVAAMKTQNGKSKPKAKK